MEYKNSIKDTSLFEALNHEIIKKVSKSNLPYFIFDETNQEGETFAEKIKNSLNTVFAKGVQNIIIVGNDTPQLTTKHILKAATNFSKGKLTFGKSYDGGFYLMTFNSSNFNSEQIVELPWQTNKLASVFLNTKTSNLNGIYFLPNYRDIDTKEDALAFTKFQISHKIFQCIRFLMSNFIRKSIYKIRLYQIPYPNSFLNKGSPLYCTA